MQPLYFFHVPFFFNGSHSEKEMLKIVTNELLGILDAWGGHVNGSQSEKSVPKGTVGKDPTLTSSCGSEKDIPVSR